MIIYHYFLPVSNNFLMTSLIYTTYPRANKYVDGYHKSDFNHRNGYQKLLNMTFSCLINTLINHIYTEKKFLIISLCVDTCVYLDYMLTEAQDVARISHLKRNLTRDIFFSKQK